MSTKIYVNLPVKDVSKTTEFFTKLRFSFNAQFSNEQAACMVISETIFIMLLAEQFFKTFTKKEIADATKSTEAILCLMVESKEKVDEMVSLALAAGGSAANEKQDQGFMYGHSFQDLDGHIWEVGWMNEAGMEQG